MCVAGPHGSCQPRRSGARILLDNTARGGLLFATLFPAVLVATMLGDTSAGTSTLIFGIVLAKMFRLPFIFDAPQLIAMGAFVFISAFIMFMVGLMRGVLEVQQEGQDRAVLRAHEMKHRTNKVLDRARSLRSASQSGA